MSFTTICRLCNSSSIDIFFEDKDREYFCCLDCKLVFVPPKYFLPPEEEKKRYDFHQNSPNDKNYREFLNRLFIPLNKLLKPNSCGLDFGSGPGPTLSIMFEEIRHTMRVYDYFYAKNLSVFDKKYDFITATEVFEHLHNPKEELNRLWNCLKPGGYLGIMTKLVPDYNQFANWHYKRDLTHVSFFSQETFIWLQSLWKAELIFTNKDVIILHKTDNS